MISYGKLLDVFWASHDPRERPWKRQYMSAIFTRGDEQRNLAIRSRSSVTAREKGEIYTEVLPASRFYPAEAYHQKFALRGRSDLLKEYEAMYPSLQDFLASTAVTRVNGYVAGYGTCESLRGELDGLGLSPAGRKRLEGIVCSHGAPKGRSTGVSCPAG
ncbi:MAG: Methionine sulfoxide reductase [Deltaproteobacteria bacterium]|nr:Methionine sulfoxide reductase [Deltaproteobacteria bacterium]MBS1245154.1 Methionine sulfoxide reductase [Deltaproteobacteria bacterium]